MNGSTWDPTTIIAGSITLNGGSICATVPLGGLPIKHAVLAE
ncbi:MAG: hypothetical protein ACREM2_04040 [Vulcanimicrobiaceae bacterium]